MAVKMTNTWGGMENTLCFVTRGRTGPGIQNILFKVLKLTNFINELKE
jgi:hypothetical protein